MKEKILARLAACPGDVSFYCKNLATGESFALNENYAHRAASIIKLPVMAEALRQFESGEARADETLTIADADRVPPCGVLTFMHSGLKPTLMDLVWLMITISDNMATNLLIERLGIDKINGTIASLGLKNTALKRKLFEKREHLRGLTNTVSALDMGIMLEKIYCGEAVSKSASKTMLDVLFGQQLSNKIPLLLGYDYKIAHKTGEDDGVTHDVGIVFAKQPFVVCFCGSGVNPPETNVLYAEIARELAEYCGGAAV